MKKLLMVGVLLGAAAFGVKRLTGAWPDPRSLRGDLGGEMHRIKEAVAEAVSAGRRAAAAREAEFEREMAAAAR